MKRTIRTLYLFSLFVSHQFAIGEVKYQIDPMPPVTYDSQGAPQAPSSVATALASGSVTPGVQLALHSYLIQECVAKTIAEGPNQRTPYVTAHKQFQKMSCTLARCFQKSLILDYWAQSSPNPSNGGSSEPSQQEANKYIAQMLEQQLAKNACASLPPPGTK